MASTQSRASRMKASREIVGGSGVMSYCSVRIRLLGGKKVDGDNRSLRRKTRWRPRGRNPCAIISLCRLVLHVSGQHDSVVRSIYDNLGRVSQQSQPYISGQVAYFKTTQYDLRNRPVSIQRPVSEADSNLQTTLVTYNKLTETVTDPYNRTSTTLRDALGQVVKLTDSASGQTLYEYEQFGNQTRVTDAAGNPVVTTYDKSTTTTQPESSRSRQTRRGRSLPLPMTMHPASIRDMSRKGLPRSIWE